MVLKKTISLILAGIICTAAMSSCAKSKTEGKKGTEGEVTREEDGITFVDADYEGQDFTFLTLNTVTGGQKDYYCGNFLDAEEYTGEKVNDAVFDRNMIVEDKYNVNIVEEFVQGGSEELRGYYMAGDFTFDVIYSWGIRIGPLILDNYYYDMTQLDDICNFDADYWSPSTVEDLTIADRMYLAINDISMNKLAWASFLFFNKQIIEDYNLEKSPYDYVDSNEWTLENYFKMATSVSDDLDGNGIYTRDDRFGSMGGLDVSLVQCGVLPIIKNDDGTYKLNIYSDKVVNIINLTNQYSSQSQYFLTWEMGTEGDYSNYVDIWTYYRSAFAEGHALFCSGSAFITSEFRDMEDEYGVVPHAKYDSSQDSYYTTIDACSALFAIPNTVRKDVSTASFERTGVILEYMAYNSNKILLPAYYEETIKTQRVNDPKDQEMLEIVRKSIRYDWFRLLTGGDTDDIIEVTKAMFKGNNPASVYARSEKKLQNKIDDYYDKVLALK